MTDISTDDIRAQLDRILASPGFANVDNLRIFLTSLVDRAIKGDRGKDAIVEGETDGLRSRLEEYYVSAGKDDPVIIELPEDANLPVFRQRVEATGYQPSIGRKLFMLGLCLAALIAVWVFYFLNR